MIGSEARRLSAPITSGHSGVVSARHAPLWQMKGCPKFLSMQVPFVVHSGGSPVPPRPPVPESLGPPPEPLLPAPDPPWLSAFETQTRSSQTALGKLAPKCAQSASTRHWSAFSV